MAFDEDRNKERKNVLCLTSQGICQTSLAAKYILEFEDIKANCAFVASLCKRAGCKVGNFCLKASKTCNGKDFNMNCERSLTDCKEVLSKKSTIDLPELGLRVPVISPNQNKVTDKSTIYIH